MKDDLISRQAAKETVCSLCRWEGTENCDECEHPIYDIPSAQKRGNWIDGEYKEPIYDLHGTKTWAITYKCSECGFIHTVIENFGSYSYCPNCGASMKLE